MRPSLILDTVTRAAFPPVLLFSLYLLFVGHNAPGGGFVGGLTAGIALVLLYAGDGMRRLRTVATVSYEMLLGAGLALAGITGLGSLVLGEPFLTSAILETEVPLLGEIKLVTVLFFDIGVYLIVVGLVLALVSALGPDAAERAGRRSPEQGEAGEDDWSARGWAPYDGVYGGDGSTDDEGALAGAGTRAEVER